jgi:hypothetical protein
MNFISPLRPVERSVSQEKGGVSPNGWYHIVLVPPTCALYDRVLLQYGTESNIIEYVLHGMPVGHKPEGLCYSD